MDEYDLIMAELLKIMPYDLKLEILRIIEEEAHNAEKRDP